MRAILVASAIALLSPQCFAATHLQPASIEIVARADGSIQLEGKRYTDADLLRKALLDAKARNPRPAVKWVSAPGVGLVGNARAIVLLQKTGVFPRMGFVIQAPSNSDAPQNKLGH